MKLAARLVNARPGECQSFLSAMTTSGSEATAREGTMPARLPPVEIAERPDSMEVSSRACYGHRISLGSPTWLSAFRNDSRSDCIAGGPSRIAQRAKNLPGLPVDFNVSWVLIDTIGYEGGKLTNVVAFDCRERLCEFFGLLAGFHDEPPIKVKEIQR